ncbi:MAG: radical protein [Clostridia bacterium]|jgi:histone acetyltransferase (RNA polymerase elongator complex component)|nr:radical protein [Clostridia bacterium]
MSKDKRHYIIPIFVSHRGCPHDCIFCNQKKITGQGGDVGGDEVKNKIEEYLQTIPKENAIVELAFYGGSFTAIPIDQQESLLRAVQPYIAQGAIQNIRISTRPDCIDMQVIQLLKSYRVQIVELGVQSMDDEVLKISNRGHNSQDVINAVTMLKQHGFIVGVQVMVGLPNDTMQKSINTVKKLIELKPDIARIYPVLVITNTYLEQLFYREEYQPLSLEATVEICKKLLILFEKSNIEVIRIGLQPTENILEGKEVVAGPFHSSMRQLVVSAIYRDMIEYMLKDEGAINKLEIVVHPQDISDILGQKRNNFDYIKSHMSIGKLVITQSNDIDRQCILLKYGEKRRKMSRKDFHNISTI